MNSMVFNSGDFKNGIAFSLRIPQDPAKGTAVAACAAITAKMENTCKKIMWYINSMVFNGGDFKNGISFSFRIPPDPPKGALGWEGAETYKPQKIMWHINSRDFNAMVVNSKQPLWYCIKAKLERYGHILPSLLLNTISKSFIRQRKQMRHNKYVYTKIVLGNETITITTILLL